MTIIQAIALGLVQGLTEFLPISSSGHLVIGQHLLGLTKPEVTFDILVHLATALAIIAVFLPVLFKLKFKTIYFILLASLPAAIVGLSLNQHIETIFSSLPLVSLSLIITAFLLFISKKFTYSAPRTQLTCKDSVFIGLFQALAIIPGISRSGSTIVAGLFRHLSPKSSYNFSFLIALPAILGAQLLNFNKLNQIPTQAIPAYVFGFLTAFISGVFSLKILKNIIQKGQLHYFAYYCLALAVFTLIYSFTF